MAAGEGFRELQKTRTESLGWLLGYGFALLDRLVVQEVRDAGHPRFGGALSTLTKAMPPSGEASVGELAARASVTKQAMSQVVVKMEELSYVRVRSDPSDARVRLVSYSAKGEGLARLIVETALRHEALCREELGTRDLKALARALKRVIAVLERETAREQRSKEA